MTPAVALVGAGPGDPELLTLRAEELLGAADVVVVDAPVLALAERFAPTAEIVVVTDGQAAAAVLVGAAALGRAVVRLYRGDPWLHPAHEAERVALGAAGVDAESVAGIAVEIAVPALAGVPVQVRHLSVACTLGSHADLPPARDPARTFVASGADPVALARSVAATGDPGLPAAVVDLRAAALPWRGSLGQASTAAALVAGPALLVVGAVCRGPAGRAVAAPPPPAGVKDGASAALRGAAGVT